MTLTNRLGAADDVPRGEDVMREITRVTQLGGRHL